MQQAGEASMAIQPKWEMAAGLLEHAARIIRQRSAERDSGEDDTITVAAEHADTDEATVLSVMTALKLARFEKSHDHDSAIDFLAYQARQLAGDLYPVPEPQTDMREWGPPMDAPEGVAELIERGESDDPQVGALKAGEATNV